ncbi:MAG: hypothetical protein LC096_00040 [Bacteroidia bacterium]|nr:hypothetical protein [Bacteroidia bacterium]
MANNQFKYIEEKSGRLLQLKDGAGKNQFVRASDFNALIDILANLGSLVDATDDSDAASKGVPVGNLYRSTSTIKVRIS